MKIIPFNEANHLPAVSKMVNDTLDGVSNTDWYTAPKRIIKLIVIDNVVYGILIYKICETKEVFKVLEPYINTAEYLFLEVLVSTKKGCGRILTEYANSLGMDIALRSVDAVSSCFWEHMGFSQVPESNTLYFHNV